MKMKKMMLFAACLVWLAGCSNEETLPGKDDGVVRLQPSISALSRSPHLDTDGSGSFSPGDIFSLTISAGNGSPFVRKDFAIGTTTLYWNDLNLPETEKEVSFAGCYPKIATDERVVPFNVKDAVEKDLLLAPAVTVERNSDRQIPLPFFHAMHRLVVRYSSDTFGSGELDAIHTSFRAVAECRVDMQAGKTAGADNPQVVDFPEQQGKEVSCLIVPQDKDRVTLTVVLNGLKETFRIPDSSIPGESLTYLEGGKQLIINLKVNKDGISIAGMDIQPWKPQGSIDGSVILKGLQ